MEQKYTLYYFPFKALGEPVRLILSYANIKFEDVRISEEEWPKYKDSMPLKQMPVLQIGDRRLHQTSAICRYLARKFNLAGSNEDEDLEIDMAVETINDLKNNVIPAYYQPDEVNKEKHYEYLLADVIPFLLKSMDDLVAKNKGHFALQRLTWADLYFVGIFDFFNVICRTNIGVEYSNLKKLVDRVRDIPQIKAWYEIAPKSQR